MRSFSFARFDDAIGARGIHDFAEQHAAIFQADQIGLLVQPGVVGFGPCDRNKFLAVANRASLRSLAVAGFA